MAYRWDGSEQAQAQNGVPVKGGDLRPGDYQAQRAAEENDASEEDRGLTPEVRDTLAAFLSRLE